MKYFDAFSGYGGFSLGIQQAYDNRELLQSETTENLQEDSPNFTSGQTRATCIGFSEIDKYASQIYQKHFPYEQCENCRMARERECNSIPQGGQETVNLRGTRLPQDNGDINNTNISSPAKNNCECRHKPYGSITDIDATTLPDFDLFVGGFPCQAFSIAGKRAGFEDTRGTLIYDVFRIIKEKHPKLVLLENVKGLLSHDSGRTFKTIITSLAELGYAVQWQVLNAKNFGVPQNRERVFIIGHLGGFGGRQVFPIRETEKFDIQPTKELPVQISNTLRTNYSNGFSNETYVQSNQSGLRQIRQLPDNPDTRGGVITSRRF